MDDTEKIRVLHIHTLPVVSGSGINTFLTMKLSDGKKFKSSLACLPGGKLEDEVKKSGFDFYNINHFRAPISLYHDIIALIEIVKLLKNKKFDIIHTHNSKAGFIGRLAGKIAGNVKIIHTVHGFAFHPSENFIRRNIFLALEKIAAGWADYLIFISGPLIEWAEKEKLVKCRFEKIYSGIDVQSFKLPDENTKDRIRKKYGLLRENFIIGEVAKLWSGKGHKTIIEAAKILKNKIPELKVVFAGEGYLYDELNELVKEYELSDTVIFTGFIEEVNEITSVMDVAMLISDFEGMGRVILEAMICKTPVIGAAVGGIVDLISDGENGLLVEPANPEMLAEKILYLYNNPDLRSKFIHNASKKIDSEFTAETMVRKINKIYEEITRK